MHKIETYFSEISYLFAASFALEQKCDAADRDNHN